MMNPHLPQETNPVTDPEPASASSPEQTRRAAIYSLLAALLRDVPSADVLAYAAELESETGDRKSDLALGFATLALAARHSATEALRDEFHTLFIGLGRGELVPYGSWYQTGFLMEQPLGLLRADLAQLGIARAEDVHEPEDHVAALCEVMAILIQDGVSLDRQRRFFDSHIGGWAGDFFDDLGQTQSAVFYRSVARLGSAFIALEKDYLSLLD